MINLPNGSIHFWSINKKPKSFGIIRIVQSYQPWTIAKVLERSESFWAGEIIKSYNRRIQIEILTTMFVAELVLEYDFALISLTLQWRTNQLSPPKLWSLVRRVVRLEERKGQWKKTGSADKGRPEPPQESSVFLRSCR